MNTSQQREQALRNEFFHQVDEDLMAELESKSGSEKEVQALCDATGFADSDLLNELVALGLSPETIMAISLVPLILVAWADGNVDSKERHGIFESAKVQGITDGSPAAKMLKHWLNAKPEPQLRLTWIHYIQQIRSDISETASLTMRADFDRRTRAIAKASGGMLGFGKISKVEQSVIDDLREAFGN